MGPSSVQQRADVAMIAKTRTYYDPQIYLQIRAGRKTTMDEKK